jgi:uncharacterized membrane protein
MNNSSLLVKYPPKSLLKLAITIVLALFAGKYILRDALPLFGFDEKTLGDYWDYRWLLIGHISGGIIAVTVGPFQFWKSFRNKYMTAHRWLGRTYLIAILVGSISGTYLAWTTAGKVNFSWSFGLQMLAFAWITTALMAYISVMRKRIIQHKEWMIRSYVVTLAFANFRWLTDLEIAHQLMNKFAERGPTMVWLSWTIPLLVTEVVISWKKK